MEVILQDISKRFGSNWIFRSLSYKLVGPKKYVITGSNGSGKSTFIKIIAGLLTPSQGSILYKKNKEEIPVERIYKQLAWVAPYQNLIEELSLNEMLDFHLKFNAPIDGWDKSSIIQEMQLEKAADKQINNFSSGMKQRLKLGMALLFQNELFLLDEPASNLDEQGLAWYLSLMERFAQNKLVILASNRKEEYPFCDEEISIHSFQKSK